MQLAKERAGSTRSALPSAYAAYAAMTPPEAPAPFQQRLLIAAFPAAARSSMPLRGRWAAWNTPLCSSARPQLPPSYQHCPSLRTQLPLSYRRAAHAWRGPPQSAGAQEPRSRGQNVASAALRSLRVKAHSAQGPALRPQHPCALALHCRQLPSQCRSACRPLQAQRRQRLRTGHAAHGSACMHRTPPAAVPARVAHRQGSNLRTHLATHTCTRARGRSSSPRAHQHTDAQSRRELAEPAAVCVCTGVRVRLNVRNAGVQAHGQHSRGGGLEVRGQEGRQVLVRAQSVVVRVLQPMRCALRLQADLRHCVPAESAPGAIVAKACRGPHVADGVLQLSHAGRRCAR